jgi:hypothetical protein
LENKLKLVGVEEAPTQPQFPRTNIQFVPTGLAVQIYFADDIVLTKLFDKTACEQIRQHLNRIAKEERDQLAAIQQVQSSKLH